ncbi:MAG: hypothetical protein IKC64_05240 [Clostridia bacterium]|nr:hypothetical protein [Clostridia bacterium]
MDYGKLAYMKAEELERRMINEKSERMICADYTATPSFDLTTGKSYPVCVVKAEGTLTLILVISLSGDEGEGEVKVYLGDKTLISSKVEIEQGKTQTITLTRAFSTSGSAIVSVAGGKCAKILESVQVVAVGQNADIITNQAKSAVDNNGQSWGLVCSENERVRMYPFSENEFNLSAEIFVGYGANADICASQEGWTVCYIDDEGNTTVASVLPDNTVTNITVIGSGASACAIATDEGKYILCEIVDDKLYCRKLSSSFSPSERVEVSLPFVAEGIAFVKGVPTPMLTIYSKGRSYLKVIEPKPQKFDAVSVTITLSINA